MNPSGFQDTYIVMRNVAGARKQIIDAFSSGQLALDDAELRFQDTGDNYNVFKAIGDPDQTIIDASGVLQDQIDNIDPSGVQEGDVINIVNNNIGGITSGVVSQLRFNLDINADDDNVTHGILFDIPMAEWKTNQVSRWNLKTPVGGVSGIVFDMSWFAEKDATGEMKFDLSIKQLPSGQDVSTPIASIAIMKDTQSFLKNILNIQSVNVEATIPGLEDISLEVKRNDALITKIRAISYGIVFKSSGVL